MPDLGDVDLGVLEPDGRFSFLSETEADERGGPEKHKAERGTGPARPFRRRS